MRLWLVAWSGPVAMAPATLLAQGVAFTDLDGPLLLAEDRDEPLCLMITACIRPPQHFGDNYAHSLS